MREESRERRKRENVKQRRERKEQSRKVLRVSIKRKHRISKTSNVARLAADEAILLFQRVGVERTKVLREILLRKEDFTSLDTSSCWAKTIGEQGEKKGKKADTVYRADTA